MFIKFYITFIVIATYRCQNRLIVQYSSYPIKYIYNALLNKMQKRDEADHEIILGECESRLS